MMTAPEISFCFFPSLSHSRLTDLRGHNKKNNWILEAGPGVADWSGSLGKS